MLSKREGLRPAQLGPVLAESSHLPLACKRMLLGIHLNIILGEATSPVVREESAVSAIKDVYFRVGQLGILFCISSTVLFPHMTSHDGCSVGGILAVKDQKSLARKGSLKELIGQQFLVVVINSTVDVTTIEFVLESTVDDQALIIVTVKFTVKGVDQRLFCDPGDAVWLALLEEMWQYGLVEFVNIHHRVQTARHLLVCLRLHDIPRVLEHAQ